jgi:hypothetical protein
MPQMKLTDAFIAAYQAPKGSRVEIADARCIGLTLRVTSTGAKSFSFRFRPREGGNPQRVAIGNYPSVKLGAARAQADKMRAAVALGNNPAEQRREQRSGGRSFNGLADRYLAEHASRHKKASSRDADERNLRLHVRPKWGKRDYKTIRRGDVIELVEGLIAAGKHTLANRVQSLVSKIFSFAIDAGLRDDHPCARMSHRGVEGIGERVLSDYELRAFWLDIVDPQTPRQAALGLRLTLLTGARISEIAGLCRDELQGIESEAAAAWEIPGERTKNGREHVLPLCPMARDCGAGIIGRHRPARSIPNPAPWRTRTARQEQAMAGNVGLCRAR